MIVFDFLTFAPTGQETLTALEFNVVKIFWAQTLGLKALYFHLRLLIYGDYRFRLCTFSARLNPFSRYFRGFKAKGASELLRFLNFIFCLKSKDDGW